jgi:hypothetical protein
MSKEYLKWQWQKEYCRKNGLVSGCDAHWEKANKAWWNCHTVEDAYTNKKPQERILTDKEYHEKWEKESDTEHTKDTGAKKEKRICEACRFDQFEVNSFYGLDKIVCCNCNTVFDRW